MLVKNRMTSDPLTVTEGTTVAEALSFMKQHSVRRLPVMDHRKKHMVGIISEKDLLYASPSPATSLSVYEIGYLLSRLKVEEIMTKDVITVSPDAPLEDAARIMADNKIGGLPVVEDGKLVGIITETDIFKVTLEMLGAREHGVRLTLRAEDKPGTLSEIAHAIASKGGDIIALGTFGCEGTQDRTLMVKVRGLEKQELLQTIEPLPVQVLDVRN